MGLFHSIMQTDRKTAAVAAAWCLIAALFAVVTRYTTETSWDVSLILACVMAAFSGFVSARMCRWSDRREISRVRLIVFFGIGLALTLITTQFKESDIDPISLKLFVFSLAGMILTAFLLPQEAVEEELKVL